jgi:putative peptidoglycan lipid II flippase
MADNPETAQSGLVRAATIIAAGNVASRVLGLVRETVVAYLFGATGYVSIFRVAATLVQTLYDFLVGGMVSAALVPVFSDFGARGNRFPGTLRDTSESPASRASAPDDLAELSCVASVVINVIAIALVLAILLLEIFAPQVVFILGSGYDPALQDAAVGMVRLILPAVFFLGMSGVITGLLYSLKRFIYPAFTTAAFNLGIVLVAIALAPVLGITSLILGILVGSALQVALQLPGLRGMNYRFAVSFGNPAIKRILRLYAPVVAGLTIMVVGVAIDRNLASRTGAQSLAWMQSATVLIQFPLGLVGTAIAYAILPELSRQATDIDYELPKINPEFQSTLGFGIKLVLLLILPAAVGLFTLARPIVSLLFEHGAFTSSDTTQTALALQFYVIGLPFAAIDQPLVFAFYARKNTLLPNLVQFAAVAVYLIVALGLIQSLGMIGLVIANSAQLTSHALLMLWFTRTRLGGFAHSGVIAMLLKAGAAACAMGLITYLALGVSRDVGGSGTIGSVVNVVLPGISAALAYVALLKLFGVQEADQIWKMVGARWLGRPQR